MISSRTPEGEPQRCPICGKIAALEPSDPGGDWICPSCGSLFWHLRDRVSGKMAAFHLLTSLRELDSLDFLDLQFYLERRYDVRIPRGEMIEGMQTVQDLIRYLVREIQRREEEG
jgi:hypothetical protein